MNRFRFMLALLLCFSIVTIGTAFAAGNFPWTKNRQLIPNITSIAPATDDTTGVTKGRCDTVTGTKGVFKGYTTVGYVRTDIEVVDSAGAPVPVTWLLDGAPVAVGPTFSFTNTAGSTYSAAAYQPYSAASRALTSCRRPQ